MRESAWQIRIDELEQLLREAEEKVKEREELILSNSSSSSSKSSNSNNINNRLTAEGRRKLTTFAAKLSELSSASRTRSGEGNTNNNNDNAMVMRSRIATIEQLRVRGEATLLKLKDTPGTNATTTTMTTTKSRASVSAMTPQIPNDNDNNNEKEEEAMVLHFQNQVLREQDEELTDLSNHVTRTKHIALAVGEELDLHTRLLDDFDDDVEHTSGNLKRIASSARRLFERIGKSNFSLRCCLAVLIFMLVVLVALSILKVEGKFHPKFT